MQGATPERGRSFVALLGYRLLITLSYQVMAVVVGWHVYELTRDPLALGLVGLAEVLPYFACALFAGYAVDHYARRRLAMLACAILLLTSLALAALSAANAPVGLIYAAVAASGLARAFLGPSYHAMFALILPRARFARGAAVGSAVFQLALILGPALGGVLVGASGRTSAYGVSAGLALAALLALVALRLIEPPRAPGGGSIFAAIGEGLRFVRSRQVVVGAMALDMFAVLFGGAVALLPAFIQEILHHGPEGLGILRAAPAVGAVLTGIAIARRPPERHAGRLLLWSVAGFGVCIILFGLSEHFWLSALLLLMSGVFDGVSVVLRTTILQLSTPDALRGRVSAINGIFIGSSNELGAFESGLAARLLGLVPSVVFGGAATIGVVLATAKLAPELRRLDLRQLH